MGATHKSNAEALSVVPFFSPSAQTPAFAWPTFAQPVFFSPLSTDYKETKGLLVVYNMGCASTCFNNHSFISVTLYVDESKEKFKVLFAFRIARVIFLSLVESMFSFSFGGVMSCITF